MNTKLKYNLIVLSFLTFGGIAAGEMSKSFLSVQDILSGWKNNYGELKSMKVSWSKNLISIEPPQRDPNYHKNMPKHSCIEITEEDGKFRSRSSISENCFNDINSIEETSFDGIHQKIYSSARKKGNIYAGLVISNPGSVNLLNRFFLLDPEIDYAGRIINTEPEFSRTIKEALSDPNLVVSVRPYLEEMAGQICHVIDIDFIKKDKTKEKGKVIWMAHEKGMLPVKIQQFNSYTNKMFRERAIEQIDFAKTENGGLWYPRKAYELMNLPNTMGALKVELNVTEFVPNIKVDPNVFTLDFPNGTQVSDAEMGISYTVGVKQH
jgi:hypothetical protein